MKYAGFWLRFVAYVIDTVVLYLISFGIDHIIFLSGGYDGYINSAAHLQNAQDLHVFYNKMIFLTVPGLVIYWLYFTLLESSSWQATLGKRVLRLKVTDENGNRISFGRANARYWSKIISSMILLIGFIMAAFTEKKQALHDLIARTLVIKA